MLDILFPNAPRFSIALKSAASPRYNCIAFAVYCEAVPIWPDEDNSWPIGMPRNETVDQIIEFFRLVGFEVCSDSDTQFDAKFEKVAIYAADGFPQHVAIQQRDGGWKSKLGVLADIWHRDPYVIQDAGYGRVVKILRRRWTGRPPDLPPLHPPPSPIIRP